MSDVAKPRDEQQQPLWTTAAHDVDPVKPGARKFAGTKPARTDRDPARIKRVRKVRL